MEVREFGRVIYSILKFLGVCIYERLVIIKYEEEEEEVLWESRK